MRVKAQGPCTHREIRKEPGMLTTQGRLLSGGDKTEYLHSRKLRIEVANNLVTFLLSEETDLTLIPQNDYPRLFLP